MTNTFKEQLLQLTIEFIKKNLEEQKLTLLVDEDVEFEFDELVLNDIILDYIEDSTGGKRFDIYIHQFQIGDKQVYIDVLDIDAHVDGVYVNEDYAITWDSFNGSEIYDNGLEDNLGIKKTLNSFDYSTFFHENYDLIASFKKEELANDSEELYQKCKSALPGLIKVSPSSLGKVKLEFSTGAIMSVEKYELLNAFNASQSKQENKI